MFIIKVTFELKVTFLGEPFYFFLELFWEKKEGKKKWTPA